MTPPIIACSFVQVGIVAAGYWVVGATGVRAGRSRALRCTPKLQRDYGYESRKRSATGAGMVGGEFGVAQDYAQATAGMFGGITTVEQLEAAMLTLPSGRLFQLAEMKMHMEIPMTGGNMNGLM